MSGSSEALPQRIDYEMFERSCTVSQFSSELVEKKDFCGGEKYYFGILRVKTMHQQPSTVSLLKRDSTDRASRDTFLTRLTSMHLSNS